MIRGLHGVGSSKSSPQHKRIADICKLPIVDVERAIEDYKAAYDKSGNEQLLEYIKLLERCHKHKISRRAGD